MSWLSIFYVTKLQNIETNGKYVCKGWNRLTIHFKPMDIVRLKDKT
jgi:hypothetical protein